MVGRGDRYLRRGRVDLADLDLDRFAFLFVFGVERAHLIRHDLVAAIRELERVYAVLTGGIHLHTLLCPSEDAYRRVLDALRQAGFLLEG